MNNSREHDGWLDATVTEQLLSGEAVAQDADGRVTDLARLLGLAAAPPAGNPEHEQAALAAFRQAVGGQQLAGAVRRTRRALPVKAVIAGVAAVFAVSGVAIAAQTGALPGPFHSRAATPRPETSAATAPVDSGHLSGTHGSAPGTGLPNTPPDTSPTSSHPAVTTTPATPAAPGVKGLCDSYDKAKQQGKALDPRSQAHLEQAAGSKEHVEAYCAQLIGTGGAGTDTSHGKSPTERPTQPAPKRK